jgi:hypothetical protein
MHWQGQSTAPVASSYLPPAGLGWEGVGVLRGGLPGEQLLRQLALCGKPWRLQVVGVAADLVQAQLQPGTPTDVEGMAYAWQQQDRKGQVAADRNLASTRFATISCGDQEASEPAARPRRSLLALTEKSEYVDQSVLNTSSTLEETDTCNSGFPGSPAGQVGVSTSMIRASTKWIHRI